MIALARQKTWFLGYPVTSSIFAFFWNVNFKLRICILKIMTRGSLSTVFLSLSIIRYYEIKLFNYFFMRIIISV